MITKVFSVYDSKSLAYGVPFFMPSTGAAVRAFSDLCNDSQSMVNRHPGDYVLFEIGTFDDGDGKLVSIGAYVHLGLGLDFLERKRVIDPVKVACENPLATVSELQNGK